MPKRSLHKYPLHGEPLQSLFDVSAVSKTVSVKTRPGAKLLDVQLQNGEIVLWVVEDPDLQADGSGLSFQLALTGAELPDNLGEHNYYKTLQMGPLVLHVFFLGHHGAATQHKRDV